MKTTIDEIRKLIARALEVDANLVTDDTKAGDLELWDSLGHISILAEIDRAFDGLTERCPGLASANSVMEIFRAVNDVL